jgi:hypothetical protein
MWGQWALYLGATSTHAHLWLTLAVGASLAGLLLLLPLPFGPGGDHHGGLGAPRLATVVLCAGPALLLVILFFVPDPLHRSLQSALIPAPTATTGTL